MRIWLENGQWKKILSVNQRSCLLECPLIGENAIAYIIGLNEHVPYENLVPTLKISTKISTKFYISKDKNNSSVFFKNVQK